MNARLGWLVMESPNLIWSAICYIHRDPNKAFVAPANAILLSMFTLHYANRSIIYPLSISLDAKPLPIRVFFAALIICSINGYLQCANLCLFQAYPLEYHWSLRFVVGVMIWFLGFYVNISSDRTLINLRSSSPSKAYKIPYGGLFEFVSCANFFGEMMEWFGYAIAANSYTSMVFFIYTCSNLIPRALMQHKWYLQKFENYPSNRKAVFPFLL